MEAQASRIVGLEEVYAGLEELEGDRVNELLKRFYTILTGWRTLFGRAAVAADQTLAFGLYNLTQVRKHYPIAAAVAYTRKSSAEDICAFLAAGGDGAMMKPHGPTDEAIRAATRNKAPELIEYLKGIAGPQFYRNYLAKASSIRLLAICDHRNRPNSALNFPPGPKVAIVGSLQVPSGHSDG